MPTNALSVAITLGQNRYVSRYDDR